MTQSKADALALEAQLNGYPAFVRVAWMQVTIDDKRSRLISALGMMGEAGEACEVIKKRVRGDTGEHVSDDKLLMELGDVWFYLVLAHMQWGFDPNIKISNWPPISFPMSLTEPIDQLIWAMGDLMLSCASLGDFLTAEIGLTPTKTTCSKSNFVARTDQLFCALNRILMIMGKTQSDLEDLNVKKLTTRLRSSGTLRGSGSDR